MTFVTPELQGGLCSRAQVSAQERAQDRAQEKELRRESSRQRAQERELKRERAQKKAQERQIGGAMPCRGLSHNSRKSDPMFPNL